MLVARMKRVIQIDGAMLSVPQYVNRTVSGWQARVRGLPSQHFADLHHGGPSGALDAAARAARVLVKARGHERNADAD
ncbi:MAG: hypothetical protein WCY98_08510 [Castellaniella sp.]